jgi:hypothetical protein
MRPRRQLLLAIAIILLVTALGGAGSYVRRHRPDPDRVVAGGGIGVPGWRGVIDTQSVAQGRTITDSKFEQQADGFRLTIGPAAYYWNPANTATGNYEVTATFTEPRMVNNHPHPMGLFIGGANLGAPDHILMYCSAYRDGSFIVRGFNGNHVTEIVVKTPNAAVHKVGDHDPVTQQVGWIVNDGGVACAINGSVVAHFARPEIVAQGRLASTDGLWGIRVSHNMDVVITNLRMTKFR